VLLDQLCNPDCRFLLRRRIELSLWFSSGFNAKEFIGKTEQAINAAIAQ
jgi:hypothetical protein